VGEAGAGRIDVHGPALHPESRGDRRRGGRDQLVGGGGAEDEHVHLARVHAGRVKGQPAGLAGQGGGGPEAVLRRVGRGGRIHERSGCRPPGLDAAALLYPLLGRVEDGGEVLVGDHPIREGGAPAGDDAASHRACSQAIGCPVWTLSPGWARLPFRVPAKGERTSRPETVPRRVPTSTGVPSVSSTSSAGSNTPALGLMTTRSDTYSCSPWWSRA